MDRRRSWLIGGASNAASGQQSYAPGMLLSVYGTALGNFVQSAGTIPLPQYLAGFEASVNGVTAPLYYVSPGQVNIQIPYETQPGTHHSDGWQSVCQRQLQPENCGGRAGDLHDERIHGRSIFERRTRANYHAIHYGRRASLSGPCNGNDTGFRNARSRAFRSPSFQ